MNSPPGGPLLPKLDAERAKEGSCLALCCSPATKGQQTSDHPKNLLQQMTLLMQMAASRMCILNRVQEAAFVFHPTHACKL